MPSSVFVYRLSESVWCEFVLVCLNVCACVALRLKMMCAIQITLLDIIFVQDLFLAFTWHFKILCMGLCIRTCCLCVSVI